MNIDNKIGERIRLIRKHNRLIKYGTIKYGTGKHLRNLVGIREVVCSREN